MVFYRRRRRMTNRRRPIRRRVMRKRIMRRKRMTQKLHNFKRTTLLDTLTITNSSNVKGTFVFKLSDLADYTEFTNLFDQYKINAVRLIGVPDFSGSPATASVDSIGLGSIHTAIDHNTEGFSGDETDLMQYDTYKRNKLSRGFKRYFRVNTLSAALGNNGNAKGVYTDWNKWIQTAGDGPDAEYLGLNYLVDNLGQAANVAINVYATYYLQCKSVQ